MPYEVTLVSSPRDRRGAQTVETVYTLPWHFGLELEVRGVKFRNYDGTSNKSTADATVSSTASETKYLCWQERDTVDDINPALPIIRNLPLFPSFRVLQVTQDLYPQD